MTDFGDTRRTQSPMPLKKVIMLVEKTRNANRKGIEYQLVKFAPSLKTQANPHHCPQILIDTMIKKKKMTKEIKAWVIALIDEMFSGKLEHKEHGIRKERTSG